MPPKYPDVYRPSDMAKADYDELRSLLRSKECTPAIDLTGVPTIPDDAHRFLSRPGHMDPKTLPPGFAKRTNRAIREACEEIRRRRQAS